MLRRCVVSWADAPWAKPREIDDFRKWGVLSNFWRNDDGGLKNVGYRILVKSVKLCSTMTSGRFVSGILSDGISINQTIIRIGPRSSETHQSAWITSFIEVLSIDSKKYVDRNEFTIPQRVLLMYSLQSQMFVFLVWNWCCWLGSNSFNWGPDVHNPLKWSQKIPEDMSHVTAILQMLYYTPEIRTMILPIVTRR
jgi:hypothetical protein